MTRCQAETTITRAWPGSRQDRPHSCGTALDDPPHACRPLEFRLMPRLPCHAQEAGLCDPAGHRIMPSGSRSCMPSDRRGPAAWSAGRLACALDHQRPTPGDTASAGVERRSAPSGSASPIHAMASRDRAGRLATTGGGALQRQGDLLRQAQCAIANGATVAPFVHSRIASIRRNQEIPINAGSSARSRTS